MNAIEGENEILTERVLIACREGRLDFISVCLEEMFLQIFRYFLIFAIRLQI